MMFLPLREAPRQLPLTDLTFCSYQLTLFTPPLLPLRTATALVNVFWTQNLKN